MYFGVASELTQGTNCKINKGLLGYEMSGRDNFYLSFKADSLNQIAKGKQSEQQVGFYYLRKLN